MQMMGIAAGPAIGAAIIEAGSYTEVIWLGGVLMVVTLFLIEPPVIRERQLNRVGQSAPDSAFN